MTYPTFKTRLVPISELNLTHWDEPDIIVLTRDEYLTNAYVWDDKILSSTNKELQPTHFLQLKINGKWTHEFKMGGE